MNVKVETEGFAALAAKLNGAGPRFYHDVAVSAETVGAEAVGFIVKQYRSGPGTRSATQVRTNRLRRAYAHEVHERPQNVRVDVGLIKAGIDAETLRYGALIEGYGRGGQRITGWTARAKAGGWLTFPIYDPNVPGTSKGAIIGWVRTKQTKGKPRPALPAAQAAFAPKMGAAIVAAFERLK